MNLSDLVILAKTDTAIGFVSQNSNKLNEIKNRSSDKKLITTIPTLNDIGSKIPQKYKNMVRRAKKTTFILPNSFSFRVSHDKSHNTLLSKLGWAYSTSANLSGESYSEEFAINNADIVVLPLSRDNTPSKIFRLSHNSIKRIR